VTFATILAVVSGLALAGARMLVISPCSSLLQRRQEAEDGSTRPERPSSKVRARRRPGKS
ncbi:hypothetical protein ACLBU1_29895, partial [Pseudomonas aeruginosa]|uniref:hypothetical protein n=1 Tax=Pseudomonas aeruginosa TaxID=287 RepID=UPI00396AA7D5